MKYRLVKSIADVEPLVNQVSKLADTERTALGFLPEVAYAEAAARGRLWVFIDDANMVSAYLMFGGRSPNISVKQLFVSKASRRERLGHKLIEELKSYALVSGFQTISARVAADLPANNFWEKQGLLISRQLPGSKAKDRLINERVCELHTNALWGLGSDSVNEQTEAFLSANPQLISSRFALDLNVFFDVIKDRLDSDVARRLMSAAMANELSICVTGEFSRELKRNSVELERDPVLNLALSLPTLPEIPMEVLEEKVRRLRALVFPEANRSSARAHNDHSDLVHLATCIHHKTSGFVTREKAILRAAERLRQEFQVEVLSIEDVLSTVSEESIDTPAVAVWLDQEQFVVSQMKEKERASIEAFLHDRLSPSDEAIGFALDPGTSASPRRRIVAFAGQRVVGFSSWDANASSPQGVAAYLFVDGLAAGAQHFVDHILQQLSFEVLENAFTNIRLVTSPDNKIVINTALARGFHSSEEGLPPNLHGLVRGLFRGVITQEEWPRFREQFRRSFPYALPERFPKFSEFSNTGLVLRPSDSYSSFKPMKLFRFETNLSPLVVLATGRPATIVPIQENYAAALLQLEKPQLELLPGKEAPLRIERAYFGRKPGFEKSFDREGIVVFYVSGAGRGRKEAIGIARVTFSGKVPIAKAQLEYARLGVLEDHQYSEMSMPDGNIGLFTFDSFIKFPHPVSYQKLKSLGCVGGANLVSAQRIKYDDLMRIVKAGFDREDE